MAFCKSRIEINKSVLRSLEREAVQALIETGENLHTEIVQAQVVPFKSSNLQNESFFRDDSNADSGTISLVHSTPYARRMYYHPEYNFNKSENPNAKGMWFEDWMPGGKHEKFAEEMFAKIYSSKIK